MSSDYDAFEMRPVSAPALTWSRLSHSTGYTGCRLS